MCGTPFFNPKPSMTPQSPQTAADTIFIDRGNNLTELKINVIVFKEKTMASYKWCVISVVQYIFHQKI